MGTSPARPTTFDDTLGMRLSHRAMIADAGRLTDLLAGLAAGAPTDARHGAAVAEYLRLFCTSIEHHHRTEDDVLWPILVENAGPHVDLSELTEDHDALDPILAAVRELASQLPDRTAAAALAGHLGRLRDLLTEHIAEEEATIFPMITGYVPLDRWAQVEKAAKKGARPDFEIARALDCLTDAERPAIRREFPLPARLMIKVMASRHHRRERAVFGPSAVLAQHA
ncbi:hemerythrin domain-containing protein [Rhodococcoides corynebacterioides]|uniref:Hemerythrin domain-containing protein n=1 Tax=Rhodococcoides corynebacterioides TaxID=53972 RepID=A0ABS7P0N2_9NOCA|nr:hemerythrin domain-containing protein [Rhodococcus corynebacterioides]MBY6365855.1 hemerythrin domain-containing protein [Rhodococcus corynebacterioides]MBY6408196.1 hemerythrin domain-containing protein [Rhodococcus corynebacterioides]